MGNDNDKLTDRELLERLVEGFDNFTEDYRMLRRFVYGNGEPGLAGEMRTLKARMDGISSIVSKIAIPLSITLVLSLLGFVWAVITHSVAIVPAP